MLVKPALIAVSAIALTGAAVFMTQAADQAVAHCQVPCGIYDDAARIAALQEDAATIAKAQAQLQTLVGKTDAQSFNQAARWVATKEAHASNVIKVVAEYFLTQKVKPVAPGTEGYDAYLQKLANHHLVLNTAMKAKQSADPATADNLAHAIIHMGEYYGVAGHDH